MRTSKIAQSQDTTDQDPSEQEPTTEVYVWGSNHQGQLGLGTQYTGRTQIGPRPLNLNLAVAQVSCGEEHAALVTLKGQIYTLGSNSEGRLGIGSRSTKQSSTPCLVEFLSRLNCIQISCGWGHTAAVMDSGEVFTWGFGEHGALGTGSTENVWIPQRISFDDKDVVKVKRASAGSKHTAFISDTGALYVCGTGETGQLGTGRRDKELVPVHVNLISERVKDVACGPFHTLILTERGKVYATGGNTLGQLGLGSKKSTNIPIRVKEFDCDKITQIACGHHSVAVNEAGELFVWGTGVFGEILTPLKFSPSGLSIKAVSLGAFFGVALDDSNNVWTWGTNSNGELGLGTQESRGKITHNTYFDDKRVESIACGGTFVIALGETSKKDRRSPAKSSISPHKSYSQSVSTEVNESPVRRSTTPGHTRQSRSNNMSYDLGDERVPDLLVGNSAEKERRDLRETGILRRQGNARGVSGDKEKSTSPFFKKEAGVYGRSREGSQDKSKEKRKEERENTQGSVAKTEDPLVELLLKQKGVLEKCLREEKEEKRLLEHSLKELKKRLRDLHEGPGGFSDLSEALNKQAKKLDDVRKAHDEEVKKRERVSKELNEEKRRTRELAESVNEKEETILGLKKKNDMMEAKLREKGREMEMLRQELTTENQRMKQELVYQGEVVVKLERTLDEYKMENVEKKTLIDKLEGSINRELEENRRLGATEQGLRADLLEANSKIQELTMSLQNEKEARYEVNRELEASMQREEACQEHARQLLGEVEHLREVIEQNLINEHENNTRMLQEHEVLSQQLHEKESEIEELKQKVNAMEQDLVEHQEKNKKLIKILSNEIEKQAEEFKKKTYQALVRPAGMLAQNIVRASQDLGNNEGYNNTQNVSPMGKHERIVSSFMYPSNTGEGAVWSFNGEKSPMAGDNPAMNVVGSCYSTGGQIHASEEQLDIEKLRRELYEDKSTVESRMPTSPEMKQFGKRQQFEGVEGIDSTPTSGGYNRLGDMNRSCVTEKDEGQRRSMKYMNSTINEREGMEVEDARKRLDKSAQKLRDILDISYQEGPENLGKSMTMTPLREDRRRELDTSGYSRGKSASPYKNVPTFRDKKAQNNTPQMGQSMVQETYQLESLREVKQRLEMLQRNKQVLEDKMQDYEKRIKNN